MYKCNAYVCKLVFRREAYGYSISLMPVVITDNNEQFSFKVSDFLCSQRTFMRRLCCNKSRVKII